MRRRAKVKWDGDRYVDVSGLQRIVAETSIANIDLRVDERLLDVGCGDGFVTMLLADRLPSGSVVGVDASHLMIDTALKRLTPGGLRVQFHVDDVLDLPFDRDFDIAVSFNALHWVLDLRRTGRRSHRVRRSRVGLRLRRRPRAVVRGRCRRVDPTRTGRPDRRLRARRGRPLPADRGRTGHAPLQPDPVVRTPGTTSDVIGSTPTD
ncbi:hypothetical protein GS4_05_01455 [Gordonia soli NBRC 108243]|uniref:Methyltransferase domain-containing protein n=2 Tax=Gordonia soli TaxID=320799 RepID=M0QES0_9ACTN|nr:hypothetical protein GS4_05_01455 [Gordonia soli NBRC 108243]